MNKREYGTGSIYYIESRKRWAASLKIGVNANGTPKKKTVTGKTKKEVKDKLKLLQAEVLTGTYTEPSKLTIVDIAKSINDNKKALNKVSDTAYHRNKETIKVIEKHAISKIPVQKLSEPVIIDFMSSLTHYSNSSIKKVYAMFNAATKRAVKLGLINNNLLDEVARPESVKQTKKIRALTIDEEKVLIEAINKDNKEPYRTMLLLSLFTGMRMGEVSALKPEDLLLNFSVINVCKTLTRDADYKVKINDRTKTYAGLRMLKPSPQIQNLLRQYYNIFYKDNNYGLLFIDKKDTMISTNQVNSYYKRLIQRYNIAPVAECNQHQLRHTYATRCIESGMPAKVLQHQLGHTDITTTLNTYCDVFDNYADNYVERTTQYLEENNIAI